MANYAETNVVEQQLHGNEEEVSRMLADFFPRELTDLIDTLEAVVSAAKAELRSRSMASTFIKQIGDE